MAMAACQDSERSFSSAFDCTRFVELHWGAAKKCGIT
jgi:hypothetical protein